MKRITSIFLAFIVTLSFLAINVSAAGNNMNDAEVVTFGRQYTGEINSSDSKDFYKIVLSESGKLTVNTTVFVTLYYDFLGLNGEVIEKYGYISTSYSGVGFVNEIITYELTAGTYYFVFYRAHNDGDYNVIYKFESANETVKESYGGSNEALNTASQILLNQKYYGHFADNEIQDFYKFTLNEKTKIITDLHIDDSGYAAFYDQNGAYVYDFGYISSAYAATGNAHAELTLEAGTYYFNMRDNGTGGNYFFTITCEPSVLLSEINVVRMPDKTEYALGEELEISGLVIEATYSDGTTKIITDCMYSGFDSSTEGEKTIVVSYTEGNITKTCDFVIEVESNEDSVGTGFFLFDWFFIFISFIINFFSNLFFA